MPRWRTASGCLVSLNDLADRPPRPLAHGETLDLGGKEVLRRRVLHLNTPHVPHNWEARVLFEETTGTLLCGDLFTQLGDGPPVTDHDLVEPALAAEETFRQTSCLTAAVETMRSLAHLAPRTLAVMHGSSYYGDGAAALRALADGYAERFSPEVAFAARPSVLAGSNAPRG
ncbi:hypothetical protein ACFC0M_18970 [Streptomyces sp. NPDC056149]|uniref:hypothetical protein n=1 Tax=Streptomyces sp. NPDC056149 TaxID=3345728 RepID=UPI0035DF88B5